MPTTQYNSINFSGGGSKGAAHAGAAAELRKQGSISRDCVLSGSSAGAIAAAFLALNVPDEKFDHFIENNGIKELLTMNPALCLQFNIDHPTETLSTFFNEYLCKRRCGLGYES